MSAPADPRPWRHVDGERVAHPSDPDAPRGGYTFAPRPGYADHADRYVSTVYDSDSAASARERGTFTVIGLWQDDAPLAAGAIPGEHQVEGDLDYFGFQPWAVTVTAASAQSAMETAVEVMSTADATL